MASQVWSEAAAIDQQIRSIHNQAITRYMTDANNYARVMDILQGALSGLSMEEGLDLVNGGCPRGWCEEGNKCTPCDEANA